MIHEQVTNESVRSFEWYLRMNDFLFFNVKKTVAAAEFFQIMAYF
jgi:hypothetical protein